jgi:restriction system protein
MAIPDFQSLMLPLLRHTADLQEHTTGETIEALAQKCNLSTDDRAELLPSGRTHRFDDRVSWAATYLRKAGLIASPRRGRFQITERGLAILKNPPPRITTEYLKQFPEFVKFLTPQPNSGGGKNQVIDHLLPPEEIIEAAYQTLRQSLATDLLQTIKNCSPAFFEKLVVDVLVKMGYGGTRKDAGKAIGRSGDEGIDGIINEDRMGLDVIYIQAKKWDTTLVGRPEIQKFAGALEGQRARKGIFLTTSTFTKDAYEWVARLNSKIVLIDGEQLSQLMMDYNVGVNLVAAYELKRIDSDYFIDD